jgi:hypothetical protein
MEKVTVELEVPKESKELVDFVAQVAAYAMKKDWASLLTLIDEGKEAMEGITLVDDELKECPAEVISYLASQVYKTLKK